jgi:hypothetical protein
MKRKALRGRGGRQGDQGVEGASAGVLVAAAQIANCIVAIGAVGQRIAVVKAYMRVVELVGRYIVGLDSD